MFLVRLLIVLCFVCLYVVNQLVKVDIWTSRLEGANVTVGQLVYLMFRVS